MIKIIPQKQYELFLAQQGKIEQLQKENDRLKRDIIDLQSFCMTFAADQKSKAIDFPNSYTDHTDYKASRHVDKLF